MKVTAVVRNVETHEVRDIDTEAATYDDGYAQLLARIPVGWKMIAVGAERN